MTFEKLKDFIQKQMRMSHVYQPLLIRSLIDAGGSATLRQLAQSFVIQDESQLLFYEKRIKEMPVKVLKKHGIIDCKDSLVSLNVRKLTLEQKAALRMLCEQKLQEYVAKKGLTIWDYRLLETTPVPDDIRYQVLKAADGRCELCGATKKERPLHVDHIIPRNKGGDNSIDNLQVLCDKCNCTKQDKDTTDFRSNVSPDQIPDCPFCPDSVQDRIIDKADSVVAIYDSYPVSNGHTLILPVRHTPDYFSMTTRERNECEKLLRVLKNRIGQSDESITGFNVGMNCGESAGQTILHAHIHLIPRRSGDTLKPRGGVRGVIPDRMSY